MRKKTEMRQTKHRRIDTDQARNINGEVMQWRGTEGNLRKEKERERFERHKRNI